MAWLRGCDDGMARECVCECVCMCDWAKGV